MTMRVDTVDSPSSRSGSSASDNGLPDHDGRTQPADEDEAYEPEPDGEEEDSLSCFVDVDDSS